MLSPWPKIPVPPDALVTGIAVLTLLSGLSDDGPLLVVADDAQWLDRASLDALAFAARRLESEQLVLLAGARGNVPPAGFERDFPQLLLAPLSLPGYGRLLDAQPRPPRSRPREQVLAQAAGNPLALIELSKMIAVDPGAARRSRAAEPLPLTGRLTAIMTAQYASLPSAARAAVLLAAAADSPDLTAAAVPRAFRRRPGPGGSGGPDPAGRAGAAFHPSAGPVGRLPCRAVRRACRGAPTGRGRAPATSLTATPGIWPPRRWNPTSTWPVCLRTPRPRLSAAAAPPRRRAPWNAPPSSAPANGTRPGGC